MKAPDPNGGELEGSFDVRLVRRATLAFEAEESAWPGDPGLVERVSGRILEAPAPVLKPPARWAKLALGGSGLALLGIGLVLGQTTRAGAPQASTLAVPGAASAIGNVRSVEGTAPPPLAEPTETKSVPPVPRASSIAPESRPVTAAELFAKASRARREGQPERAAKFYRLLGDQFPSSREALAAFVPLGLLELKAKHFAPALTHFSAYLSRTPAGELAPEALWGQAQAHLGLGRSSAARQDLERLLMRYPDSAYASSARAKLEAMRE